MKSLIPILSVADIETSLAFYTQTVGFEVTFTMPGDDGRLMHGGVRRGASELMFGSNRDDLSAGDLQHLGAGVSLYFTVGDDEDLDALFERARAAGAAILQEPQDQFWGHRDWGITDPDGYRLFISKETHAVDMEHLTRGELAGATG